jgi:hypothetical protein
LGATKEPIHIYCATAPADGVAQLAEAVMRERPALVIIDPVIRLSRMVDSNSYSEVSNALEPFIALARESGSHVMLVHHTGRGDRQGVDAPMGSTAFAASVDTILVMRRTERMRSLSSVQRYGTDLDEVVLTMDEAGRITTSGTKREHDEAEARDAINIFLAAHPDADQQAIKEGVEGRWSIVRPALSAMVKDNSVTRKGAGKKGDPHLYSLPVDADQPEQKCDLENAGIVVPTIYREPEYQNPKSNLSACTTDSYSGSRDSAILGTSGNQKKETGNQYFEAFREPDPDGRQRGYV